MGDTETYSLQASRPMRVQSDGSRIGNTKEWAALSGLVPSAGQECKDIEAGTVKIGDGVKNYGALTALAGGGDLSGTYVRFGTTDPGPSVPAGAEYVWFKTDGNGAVVDIFAGKA